jgi:hypothetical protein
MGMFDSLHINPAQLPVSADVRNTLATADYQTKSVLNWLANLYITDDGYLEMDHAGLQADTDTEGSSAPAYLPFQQERVRLTDAHGAILFYTNTDAGWYQFNAVFANGRLVSIVQESPPPDDGPGGGWQGDSCRWSQETPVDPPGT